MYVHGIIFQNLCLPLQNIPREALFSFYKHELFLLHFSCCVPGMQDETNKERPFHGGQEGQEAGKEGKGWGGRERPQHAEAVSAVGRHVLGSVCPQQPAVPYLVGGQ